MSDELVQLHVDNGVAQVVLNRPEKMNSFTGEMHILLRETLARVEANTAIRALVLTGAGRGFCAGQDLADEAVRFTPGEAPP
ncbi:MAG: enoyl-CoA hydratase-related protein, partial [Burkholderiaceae bacterium]|nr:enoyl-CoA hydratase-related protein [Burkholderiaceae bacterium]